MINNMVPTSTALFILSRALSQRPPSASELFTALGMPQSYSRPTTQAEAGGFESALPKINKCSEG